MGFILTLIFNLIILGLWYRHRRKKGKKLAWYWGWILPSDIISLSILTMLGLGLTAAFAFDLLPLGQKQTEKEMDQIEQALRKYYEDLGVACISLDDLIGKNPLRQEWKQDYWGTEYSLTTKDCLYFRLTSFGPDKENQTSDDLRIIIDLRKEKN